MVLFVFLVAALAVGAGHFFLGLENSSYLVSNGFQLRLEYRDAHRYLANLQGLVFALSFLMAAGLMGVFILLPSHDNNSLSQQNAPQPARVRQTPNWVNAAFQATQPSVPLSPSVQTANPQAVAKVMAPNSVIESGTPIPQESVVENANDASVETEQARPIAPQTAGVPAAALAGSDDTQNTTPIPPPVKHTKTKLEQSIKDETGNYNEGEEDYFLEMGQRYHPPSDVIYGNGPITNNAIWALIRNHPESTIKFLFRKTLANKPLSPQDETVYDAWESRGMSRNRVRRIMLDIMQLPTLPNDYPHAIWRSLCESISAIEQQEERKKLRKQAKQNILMGTGTHSTPHTRSTPE